MNFKTTHSRTKQLLTVLLIICFISCGTDEPEPTLDELVIGEWTAISIERDNSNVQSDFPDFSIIFNDGTYTTKNGQHVWPESGTWSVTGENMMQILRDNNLIMDASAGTNNLTLAFQIEENEYSLGGRSQTVASAYVFTLTK